MANEMEKLNFDNGDEYEIVDASARSQIEELNETLTELTAYRNIASLITIEDSSITSINIARYHAGWVYIIFACKATQGSEVIYANVAEPYRPQANAFGYYTINASSSDAGQVIRCRITTGGNFDVWALQDLSGSERFTFIYPVNPN